MQVAAGSKSIRIIESATGHESQIPNGADGRTIQAEQAAFIKAIDPKTMAMLHKRDISSPEQIIEAVEAMGTISSEKLQAGAAVSFSADGRFLISNQMLLKNLKTEAWDTTAGTLVSDNNNSSLLNRGKPFFSPDGRFRQRPSFP